MDPEGVQRKLAAILSADVVGYSRLMAEDEAATIRTLIAYRDQIATLVREHRGRVVDSPGDNVLAELPTALDAMQAAMEVQRVIGARNADLPPERRMEFRIGVHLGDISLEGEQVYGDGINIAARLEGLAEPGGICISDMVHKQVRSKLHLGYEDLGEQELKNIPDPVQAYRVRLGPEAGIPAESLPGMDELTVPGFGHRPAIAVLPFDDMSKDADQEYLADGIAEDLITQLSSIRLFPVIARNSSFIYKGKAVDVKQVSRELGVRYVVEGSVRKAGDRIRVSAQLIDASTGAHVWADRYDREIQDIFALQDEITEGIAASVHGEVWESERKRAGRAQARNVDAWDCLMRGFWHSNRHTGEDNAKARALASEAIALDPEYSMAFEALASTYYMDLLFQWTDAEAQWVAELVRAARKSIVLDDKNPFAQWIIAVTHRVTGQPEKAIAALELAIKLNPSFSVAHHELGVTLAMLGRSDDALASSEKAIRLSPQDPLMWLFLFGVAFAHLAAGRYEDAIDWAQRSIERRPDWVHTYLVLAASYAQLDRIDEARAAVSELLRLNPDFSLVGMKPLLSGADPLLAERVIDSLRKAGMKE